MKKSFIILLIVSISGLMGCSIFNEENGNDISESSQLEDIEIASQEVSDVVLELTALQHTTRRFSDKCISDENIEKILEASFNSATSGGQQAREIIVVKDKNVMNKIKKVHPYAGSLDTAPLLIVIAGNESKANFPENLVQDTSIAAQNIVLMASALKIETNIMSIYPQKDRTIGIQQVLDLPESVVPYMMISMGYADDSDAISSASSKRGEIDSMIHYNSWKKGE